MLIERRKVLIQIQIWSSFSVCVFKLLCNTPTLALPISSYKELWHEPFEAGVLHCCTLRLHWCNLLSFQLLHLAMASNLRLFLLLLFEVYCHWMSSCRVFLWQWRATPRPCSFNRVVRGNQHFDPNAVKSLRLEVAYQATAFVIISYHSLLNGLVSSFGVLTLFLFFSCLWANG